MATTDDEKNMTSALPCPNTVSKQNESCSKCSMNVFQIDHLRLNITLSLWL
jgi:ribosomal protein S27AE